MLSTKMISGVSILLFVKLVFTKSKNFCELQIVSLDSPQKVRFTPDKYHPAFSWSCDPPSSIIRT